MGVDARHPHRHARPMRPRPSGASFNSLVWALPIALLAMFAASRIVAIAQADRLATPDPVAALRWMPGHPDALVNLAEHQLAAGRVEDASASARRLLRVAPLDGRGFRILGESALRGDSRNSAVRLFAMAERRSPRDIPSRAWLFQFALARNETGLALREAEFLLRTAPGTRDALVPLLAGLSADPAFANPLLASLHADPRWRGELEKAVRDAPATAGTRAFACWLAQADDASARQACGIATPAAGVAMGSLASGAADAIIASVANRPAVPAGR
jgi:hypothetical protein